jgi:hypothetical protein
MGVTLLAVGCRKATRVKATALWAAAETGALGRCRESKNGKAGADGQVGLLL